MARTCKTIRIELLPIFYSERTFILDFMGMKYPDYRLKPTNDTICFLQALPSNFSVRLQRLQLKVKTSLCLNYAWNLDLHLSAQEGGNAKIPSVTNVWNTNPNDRTERKGRHVIERYVEDLQTTHLEIKDIYALRNRLEQALRIK